MKAASSPGYKYVGYKLQSRSRVAGRDGRLGAERLTNSAPLEDTRIFAARGPARMWRDGLEIYPPAVFNSLQRQYGRTDRLAIFQGAMGLHQLVERV